MWTQESLELIAREKLSEYKFIVVSNRQPITHIFKKGKIEMRTGVGGVVTALEPVVRSCGGSWIVLSDGDADRAASDPQGRFVVADPQGSYTLRRIWLTREEVEGYYFGYANSVLWPLCHLVFTRPRFHQEDWNQYCAVNEKFAQAVIDEAAGQKAFVWIQDYHLAMLASILKKHSPKQFITAHFWHIPWPAQETFRICPQRKELLQGLLANDLIGFHVRYHCQNFIDSVDREMVSKIDRERDAILTEGTETLVRAYPISIDYEHVTALSGSVAVNTVVESLISEFELADKKILIGLDRIDYTKGIPEKFFAMDRLLQDRPELRGTVVMLQIGVLSRLHLQTYKDLNDEINKIIEEINWRHGSGSWKPIIFVRRQFSPIELTALYRLGDVGVVSSLHDGMNLVAKEYVSSVPERKGMLVLSQFTGAARELTDALLVNPYDRESFAAALGQALDMEPSEREKRNIKMREVIARNNIFRWAGKTISDLLKFEFQE